MTNNETIVIMGNGPSLKDVDFSMLDGIDTFGLNSAYRAYPRLDWWPTYHGCFDYRVTDNHQQSFIDLIDSGKFKKSFYIRNLSDKDNFQFVNMLPYGSTNKMNHSEDCFTQFHDNGNSGANACSAAV